MLLQPEMKKDHYYLYDKNYSTLKYLDIEKNVDKNLKNIFLCIMS